MKLKREGKNEIRIQLSREDLEAFSITLEDFDYDSSKGKKVIWELFDKAREETGFETEGEKVYIQLYPKAKGGCELFVTKIEPEDSKECFSFSDFDSFFQALSFLYENNEKISFFRWKNGETFYIILPSHKVPAPFYEFGEKIHLPSPAFLKSRCVKMENALLFSK